jgi:hypothetical protein
LVLTISFKNTTPIDLRNFHESPPLKGPRPPNLASLKTKLTTPDPLENKYIQNSPFPPNYEFTIDSFKLSLKAPAMSWCHLVVPFCITVRIRKAFIFKFGGIQE